MCCVFVSFILGDQRLLKLFGLALASAVFLDAFIVRSLLLPATLALLDRYAWARARLARPPAAAHRHRGPDAGNGARLAAHAAGRRVLVGSLVGRHCGRNTSSGRYA
jgi:hypothetical protein